VRKIFFATLLFILALPALALAVWTDDFLEDFNKIGLYVAVENALENDVQPNDILTLIISNNDMFDTRMAMKALYCAGADRNAVQESANKLGITIEEVSKAFEESLAECSSKLALSDRDVIQAPTSSLVLKPEPAPPQAKVQNILAPPVVRKFASPSMP